MVGTWFKILGYCNNCHFYLQEWCSTCDLFLCLIEFLVHKVAASICTRVEMNQLWRFEEVAKYTCRKSKP